MKLNLYCITCKRTDISYEDQVEQACIGGADAVQFRDKSLSPRDILTLGQKLKEICRHRNVLFILNDRPDLALALDADGVHLGVDDIPLQWARQILGGRKIITCSAGSLGQALAAAKEGANFLTVGPIYSEESGKEIHNVDIVRMIKERVKIPVLAMGGIDLKNVNEAMNAGADGIAASRSLCGAPSVEYAVSQMKQKLSK